MRDKLGNSLWGLAFIVVGVGIAGDVFNLWDFRLFFNGWWTLFIIVPALISMIQNGANTGNIICFIIGVLLYVNANGFLPSRLIGRLIFPTILILIGLSIIFKGSFKNSYKDKFQKKHVKNDGYISLSSVFSNQEIRATNEVVTGGAVSAVFGNIQIDLRNAIINEDVNINITSICSGVEIFVPSNVNVKVSTIHILGGVSNKALQSNLDNCPTIYFNATCIIGGVDIK